MDNDSTVPVEEQWIEEKIRRYRQSLRQGWRLAWYPMDRCQWADGKIGRAVQQAVNHGGGEEQTHETEAV